MSQYQDFGYMSAEPSHINNYLTKPLLSLLSKEKNTTILDVGCGNGWLTKILIQKDFKVYGIDASVTGIEIAKRTHKERFAVHDFTKVDTIPFPSIKFDTIISTEVVEHLYNPRAYLKFCKEILDKNKKGQIIISTPYHGYWKNLLLALTGKFDKHFTALWDGGHIKFWSRKTLSALLNETGFKIIKFKGCGRIPFLWKSMIVVAELKSSGEY